MAQDTLRNAKHLLSPGMRLYIMLKFLPILLFQYAGDFVSLW